MNMVINDLSGKRVRYQAWVQRAASGGLVTNVRDPGVLWAGSDDLNWTWFE